MRGDLCEMSEIETASSICAGMSMAMAAAAELASSSRVKEQIPAVINRVSSRHYPRYCSANRTTKNGRRQKEVEVVGRRVANGRNERKSPRQEVGSVAVCSECETEESECGLW